MKTHTYALIGSLLMAGASQAATLVFTDLNTLDGVSNTLKVAGSTTGLAVTRTQTGTAGNFNYNYAVTYTGVVDGTLTTLNYNVLVEGITGSAVTATIATIGTGEGVVAFGNNGTADSWTIGTGTTGDRLLMGETLKFTITGLTSSVGTATFDQFNAFRMQEWGGSAHLTTVGSGTGLTAYSTDGNLNVAIDQANPLYINARNANSNVNADWGVTNLGYSISVAIPEPSSAALLVGGLGLMTMRRRRS
ncbi:MAG: PEP-CTERM sorting domain-containing protein [Akkermansiaceae bacterium]|jgi:GH24 family phage-related lysozyme (muramidase)|nr:PEP-CTERM sorting domain-containing protein [Akkermansiaceae bacterium]MDP4791996.1 PEP-CTERM sorting domain-containing protein [Verrucomicrobiales bacterium]MDP4848385.1 PEP-CTERM sorting domain-containing protein [Akkermansiaceae bacterium]MDP4898358.1 PEP-CTERM sorting domain-containing protein [Akkermansiaceae bacterium]MDP4996617.1 PEP-CTERM sorting domain-containing protein [Akkermansiaceae bacterium]